jgi:hypothetical protein
MEFRMYTRENPIVRCGDPDAALLEWRAIESSILNGDTIIDPDDDDWRDIELTPAIQTNDSGFFASVKALFRIK